MGKHGVNGLVSVFESFSKPIQDELRIQRIDVPTEIQRLAIPKILAGENVLLIAPTGEGKTEAAVLPIFENFLRLRATGEKLAGISILYVTPLRSLNRDIFRRLAEVGERLGINVQVRHGDTSKELRRLQAEKPPNMLITTPETLQAILIGRRMVEHLRNVKWVIIDEVHELADDKRGIQLSVALERLSKLARRDFQRTGLSATVGDTDEVGSFLVGKGRSIQVLKAQMLREMDVSVESPVPMSSDSKLADVLMIPIGTMSRIRRIIEILKVHGSVLVFTNTREHAESLASKIRMVDLSIRIGVHHGSISKDARIEAERQIKSGELKALVCTSSLELGMDIGLIDFVVQYQSPKQAIKAVQRIGRSNHTVEGRPKGCIIAATADDILESAVILRRALQGELEKLTIHKNALDVLAHQIVGLTLNYGSLTLSEAYEVITHAYPYVGLRTEDFMATVEQLKGERRIRLYGEKIKVNSPLSHQYYFENLSMIPDVKQYLVVDFASRRRIGHLDQEFVASHGLPGSQFILHGQAWQILTVEEEKSIVEVESVEPNPAAIPSWEGEVIPVSFEVASEVGRLRREIVEGKIGNLANDASKTYRVDDSARAKAVEILNKHVSEGFPLPHDRQIVVEAFENYIIIHGCLGDKANQALSRVLASMLTAKMGLQVAVQSDPYRIALITPYPIDPYIVKKIILSLKPEDIPIVLEATSDQTNLFLWRLWNNAKRFGAVSRLVEYRLSQAQSLLRALKGTPVHRETYRELCLENFAIETLQKIVERIGFGEIKVETVALKENPSPLSMPLLDKIAPHDLLRPVKETDEIIPLIRGRLNNKTVKLICIFKGDWETTRKIVNLQEKIQCPVCKSTIIVTTYEKDEETGKTVKKKLSGRKLSSEEEKAWITAWKNASLVQTYGKKAIIAMAARGVGPFKAAKILGKRHVSEEKFYLDILRAEREYLRTKMFWD